MNLNNKTVVIFGGTGVIGNNLIETFLSHGVSKIYATFFHKKNMVKKLEKKFSDKLFFSQIDITDHIQVQNFIDKIDYVDVGVNCVGITNDKSFSKLSIKSWENVIQTNLTGVFNTSKSLFLKMQNQKKGKIINISSIVGKTGAFGQANYSASKSGIIGLTKTIALEGAKYNILVNCVMPGYIDSNMIKQIPQNILDDLRQKIPLKRFGTPDDVSNAILFLASDYSDYITGEVLNVNGGL